MDETMTHNYNAGSEGMGSGLGNMGDSASNMMDRARQNRACPRRLLGWADHKQPTMPRCT